MKTKETSLSQHKDNNGGKILQEVITLLEEPKPNNNGFKILTLLRGLGMKIDMIDLHRLQYRIDSNNMIYIFLVSDTNKKIFKEYDSDLFIKYINKFHKEDLYKCILDICDLRNIKYITLPTYIFNIRYDLSAHNREYITFHKIGEDIICKRLVIHCDYRTTVSPIYKDWYASINYHP